MEQSYNNEKEPVSSVTQNLKYASLNLTDYKSFHESFMQNNHGSTVFHTFICIFFTVQCAIYCSITENNAKWNLYLYEYIVLVFPLICVHTILANYLYALNFVIVSLLLYKVLKKNAEIDLSSFTEKNVFPSRITSISMLRGLTYLITVFCILAVDFQAFPRYLAKTERYGYSLMDTGVGLFVMMSGLVHKEINEDNFNRVLMGNCKFVTILLVLGIARFISIKQLDYQEHISEYGVHWNFFFTLAVCKITSSIALCFSSRPLLLSILILLCHEVLLYASLESWVDSDLPRTSFLSANREGISSCLGYTSLYVFGVYVKKFLNDATQYRYEIFLKLFFGSLILWILSDISNNYRPTSRIFANAGYCIYLATFLITVLTVMYTFEVLLGHKLYQTPKILLAINNNGLVYFLFANLLTGSINLTFRTLLLSELPTFVILNCYMFVTSKFVCYLNNKGIKL